MGWKKGRRGLGREEQERRRETSRPRNRKNPGRPGLSFFLFSPLRSHQLAFSFPPRQLEQAMGLCCLCLPRLPPPTLEVAAANKPVTAHSDSVKCSGNAGAATVNCTANPCGL